MSEERDQANKEGRVHVDEGWKKQVAEERERLREREQQVRAEQPERTQMPEPTIQVFMAGLYTQTLMAMGALENPLTGEKTTDLPEAEYLIDTIAMLRDKTRGNLSEEEESYVEGLLYDLRMRYVNVADRSAETEPEKATKSGETPTGA